MPATRIDLWHIPLSQGGFGVDATVMDDAEHERAARFANENLRNDFIRTHTAKRLILANYLNVAAKDLALTANSYGKPCLAGTSRTGDLRFNLSHTRSSTVMAVTRGREVGVDIEALDRNVTAMPLAKRYFSDPVLSHLGELAGSEQRRTFLRYWTQFEAYKKALGDGLRGGDSKLTFKLAATPDNHFQPLPFITQSIDWQVAELDYLAGYTLSVVVEANAEPPEVSWNVYVPERL